MGPWLAAKVLRCAREYMKQRAKCTPTYVFINNKYSLHEPKQAIKQLYVKKMKISNTSLRRKVIIAFSSNCKHLGMKVINSKQHVCNGVDLTCVTSGSEGGMEAVSKSNSPSKSSQTFSPLRISCIHVNETWLSSYYIHNEMLIA